MKKIETLIAQYGADFNCCFVFPTSIAAREWFKRALDIADCQTIAGENFMAWDLFKKRFLISQVVGLEAVSQVVRKLFALSIIEENATATQAGQALFKQLIPPNYAADGAVFADWLAGILPQLADWVSRFSASNKTLKGDEATDLFFLKQRYEKFLQEYALYEPSWVTAEFKAHQKKIIIFYPELLEDFSNYAPVLENNLAVELIHIEKKPHEIFYASEYPHTYNEITACVSRIEKLLANGTALEDIAIHVCAIDELAPYLKRECKLRGMPIQFRSGINLAQQSAGAVFSLVTTLVQTHWNYASVKNLLLHPHLPWQHPAKIKALLAFGIENNCVVSWQEGNYWKNVWKEAFKICASQKTKEVFEIESWFEKFYASLERIVNATSFLELQKSYILFKNDFLATENFSEKDNLVLGQCLDVLKNLIKLEDRFTPLMPKNRCAFFVSLLEKKKYVFQNHGSAISAFPFGVAAATPYPVQFVLNAGQSATTILYRKLSFLRKDKRLALEAIEVDATADFFRAYSDADKIFFSYAKKTLSGYTTCHRSLTKTAPFDEKLCCNSFADERQFFNGTKNTLLELTPLQKKGSEVFFKRYAIKKERDKDFFSFVTMSFGENISPLLDERLQTLYHEGNVRVSATSLKTHKNCALTWFFKYVLNVEKVAVMPHLFNPIQLGIVYHNVAEELYRFIQNEDGGFILANRGRYEMQAKKIISQILRNNEAFRGSFAKPFLLVIEKRIFDAVCALLAYDACNFAQYTNPILENELCHNENGIHYYGKIDRFSIDTETGDSVLIDYKSNYTPKKKESTAHPDSGELADFQIAMYVYLLEKAFLAENQTVKNAGFWNFKGKSFENIIDAENDGRKNFDTSIATLISYAEDFATKIKLHDFAIKKDGSTQRAFPSDFTNIFRTNFSVEGEA